MNPDTSVAPYFDDYNEDKNFSKVLFRPDRAVQARELNQLQTIQQKQISRFGDNIFKQGSVVSGCHVTSINSLPYVKILDNGVDGQRVDVSKFKQLYVRNGANTVGVVVDSASGFESQAPNLNTLFIRYISSGNDNNSPVFNANDTLTIYNPSYEIEDVSIVNGSSGYSPNDTLAFLPALSIANSTGGNTFTGGIYVGDIISNGAGANVAIAAIQYQGAQTTVTIKPTNTDLNSGNTAAWSLSTGNYVDANTGQSIAVSTVYGSGAAGKISTNGNGTITDTILTSSGSGYSVAPTVIVVSNTASVTQKNQTVISADNFVKQVTVAPSGSNPIGLGFGVTVDEGVIYQNQTFTRTDKQFVVVDKYSSTPSNVVVGFVSTSDIVTYIQDPSLVDNASNFANANAPGADRLRTTASAVVLTSAQAASRTDFVSLVEFSDGEPFKTADNSSYNAINDAMASRTYETSGNFVIDPFLVNTKSPSIANEPTTLNVVVDPGVAFINGYRVATDRNYSMAINKAIDTVTVSNVPSNVDYGNFIVCDAMFGVPVIDSIVQLRTQGVASLTASGTQIGTGRVRGFKKVATKFYVYLYDIVVNTSASLGDARSIYSNDGLSAFNIDVTAPITLNGSDKNRSIFTASASAIRHVSNVTYTFQQSWSSASVNSSGFATVSVTSPSVFPIAGALSQSQLDQVFVIPSTNVVGTQPLAGTGSTTVGSNTVTGSGTSFNTFTSGSYIAIGNTTSSSVVQVVSVSSPTSLTVSPAPTIAYTNATISPAAPANVPVRLQSAVVSNDRTSLSANFGFAVPSTPVTVIANVSTTPTIATKSVTRNAAVRLNLSTSSAGVAGPWCLGQSDVIRLSGVYLGSNTTFTSNTAGITDVTNDFYIDSNQTPELSGLGYLYQKPTSRTTLNTASRLLVVFDVLNSSSNGVRTVDSYPIADGVALPSMAATINTVELPEVNGAQQYFDTRDSFDFRPLVANTVVLQTAQSTAPINPTEPAYSTKFVGQTRFPAPDTVVYGTIEYYQPRNDLVVASSNGSLITISGQPGSGQFPDQPDKSIVINKLVVPAYPSLPSALSSEMAKIIDTKIASDKYSKRRVANYTVSTTYTAAQISEQQPRRYQMTDIGSLDRRMSAVEYSLALTMAETQTSNRNIVSANNPDTDRFKFGFFVDSFSDNSRSDTTNPQFTSTIVNGVVQPRTVEYVVSLEPQDADSASNGIVSLPYNSETLISQLGSTNGAVIPPVVVIPEPAPVIPAEPEVIPPAPVVPPAVVDIPVPVVPVAPVTTTTDVTTVKQSIETFIGSQTSTMRNKNGQVSDIYRFTLSETDGPVRLLMNFKDNRNAVEVFQTTDPNWVVPGETTETNLIKYSLAAVNWTATDRAQFTVLDVGDRNGNKVFETMSNNGVYAGDAYHRKPTFEDCGKIEWTHNAAGGKYYTIRITKYEGRGTSTYFGLYRFAFVYPKDYTQTVTVANVPLTIDYRGQFTIVNPVTFDVGSYTNADNQMFYCPPQSFDLLAVGLKPLTAHKLFFNNVDVTAKCAQQGNSIGSGLVTDAGGVIALTLFYDGQTTAGLSEFEQANAINNLLAGPKAMSITDENMSFAYATIQPKPYASSVSNTTGYNDISNNLKTGKYSLSSLI